jgi:hypothetical protein
MDIGVEITVLSSSWCDFQTLSARGDPDRKRRHQWIQCHYFLMLVKLQFCCIVNRMEVTVEFFIVSIMAKWGFEAFDGVTNWKWCHQSIGRNY